MLVICTVASLALLAETYTQANTMCLDDVDQMVVTVARRARPPSVQNFTN